MDKIILNPTAHQKPSTLNPDTNFPAINIIVAFITIKNKPKVTIVKGIVKNTKIGFKNEFNNTRTNATNIAVV